MKTSKVIFIVLTGTIAFIILAAVADLRLNGRTGITEFYVEKTQIPEFSFLNVKNSRIEILNGDSSYLEVIYLKGTTADKINFQFRNDTLFLFDNDAEVNVYSTFKNGKLPMELNKAIVSLFNGTPENMPAVTLDISSKNNSRAYIGKFKTDSLFLDLHNSSVTIENRVHVIRGTLSDSSRLNLDQPGEISLKADSTSRISIY